MSLLPKIRTANTRIRRNITGKHSGSTKMIQVRAKQLGLLTPSGYISKSGTAAESKGLKKALLDFDVMYQEEKVDLKIREKRDFQALLTKYIAPYDMWSMYNDYGTNTQSFIDAIISEISEFDTFDEDYQIEFIDFLVKKRNDYYDYHNTQGNFRNNPRSYN